MEYKPVPPEVAAALVALCQRNPWLKTGGIPFEDDPAMDAEYKFTFHQIDSVEGLKTYFDHGNWAIRSGVVYHGLAFINQINGGDEWWTLKRFEAGWLAFESITFRPFIEREGAFEKLIAALERATQKQCEDLTYQKGLEDEGPTLVISVASLFQTAAIHAEAEKNPALRNHVVQSVERFLKRDWGDIAKEDWAKNDAQDDYQLASYNFPENVFVLGHDRIWIIFDGTVTTVLFPDDY